MLARLVPVWLVWGIFTIFNLQYSSKPYFKIKKKLYYSLSFVSYDAHVLDPLANLQFTTGTYYMLASSIRQLARQLCGGRCIFFLEGGYNLQSLSCSVADSFRALLGEPSRAAEFDDPAILYEEPFAKMKQAIEKVKHFHAL